MTYYLSTDEINLPIIQKIIKGTFPDYNGRKISIRVAKSFVPDQSWSGGSRTIWKLVRMDGKVYDPGHSLSSGPFNSPQAFTHFDIPDGCMIVQHSIFCGKDTGISILVKKMDLLPLDYPDLTNDEIIVLIATKTYKSSYAGVSNYRFHEAKRQCGITLDRWETAMKSLMDKKLLAKNKAITPKGRNACNSVAGEFASLYEYKEEK